MARVSVVHHRGFGHARPRAEAVRRNELAGPNPTNRHGSWLGPTAVSFQVKLWDVPPYGDLDTAEAKGRHVAAIPVQIVKGRS